MKEKQEQKFQQPMGKCGRGSFLFLMHATFYIVSPKPIGIRKTWTKWARELAVQQLRESGYMETLQTKDSRAQCS